MRRIGRWAGAMAVASALAGCHAMGPIGPTGPSMLVPSYSYQAGTAVRGFSHSRAEVEAAVRDAMQDLAIQRDGTIQWDPEQTHVRGRASDGRRVDLTLIDRGPMTEARVRVGLFGDEPLSKAMLDRIGVRLGSLPPEAIPTEVPSDPEANPYISRDAVPDSVMLRGFSDSGYEDSPLNP